MGSRQPTASVLKPVTRVRFSPTIGIAAMESYPDHNSEHTSQPSAKITANSTPNRPTTPPS
jgi:hypothetical protein